MKKRSEGFGLIEIMVALTLGLIVSLGIIQIFVASRGTYVTQNSSARMQEDARFILSKLIQEIRMTGMYGCLKLDSTIVAPAIAQPAAMNNPILWDNTNRVLTLVTADIGSTGGVPTWTIVSDCQTTAKLYNGNPPASTLTSFPLRQVIYSLSGTDLLMQSPAGGTAAAIVKNVKAFAVSFGVSGSPMSYTSTITMANAADVRSVRLTLTLSDPDNKVRDQTYNAVATLRNRF
ncbi:prepilin-type N-terminal cleavage/methylation domain-containing protein [Xanthomonas sp. WHRI 1810A]|uniref:PilW family protein n=1 Tax=Xanthomonas sp. WHRI 1810A TaxID=3161565 RepID=UPI0032E9234D